MSDVITTLPWEITAPGDYHLEGDLQADSRDWVLKVSVAGVQLDLRGFTITGEAETVILLAASDLTLRNGQISGGALALVAAPHIRADRCLLEDLEVQGGLFVGGDALTCRRVRVSGGAFGIKGGEEALIVDCQAQGCLLGIEAAAGSRVERCQVMDCEEGVYVYGSREMPSHLERVVVYECSGLGIRLDGPGVLDHCEAHNNGKVEPSGGILAGPASVVAHCEAYGNQGGDIGIVEPCQLDHNRTSDGSG